MPFAESPSRRLRTACLTVRLLAAALALVSTAVLAVHLVAGTPQSDNKTQVKGPKDDLKQGQRLADRGDKAAAAGKTEEALHEYADAVKAAPGDIGIARRAAAVRAQIVQKIVEEAESAALDGNAGRAVGLMYKALQIDPGNTIIAERLAQMKQMPKEYLPAGPREDYELAGPRPLRPQPGRKSINVRGDCKSAYEQVAGMFGIKVAFDPDLVSKNLRLRVDGLDFYTAMQLLGIQSQTFYRVVNPTLIFVASDSIAKRKDYAAEVERTFRLDDSIAPEDITEMTRVLREITNSTKITSNALNHSLTVRESADKVLLAGQLIKELEQARRDVMLDIHLLEVNHNAALNLGVTTPTSVQAIPISSNDVKQLEQATDITNLLTLVSQLFTAQGITASPQDVLPFGGGKSTFLLTMPSATANFSQGLSLVKSGREIFLRAQDGKPATFFVGERFPVTLSLLSTSLGGTIVGGAVTSTTFARTDFAVGHNPVAAVAQDFNNDAKLDLTVVNQADSSISILLNNDNGNFTAAPGSPIVLGTNEQGPVAIASKILRATDATHLVQPADLVIVNKTSNTVSLLLGSQNFDGTFAEAPGFPLGVGAQPVGVVIDDFDTDGIPDIAVLNAGDNTLTVLKGDGLGGFAPFPNSPFHLPTNETGAIAMVSGVFDNSNKPEIAILNATTENAGIFQVADPQTFDGTFTELSGSPVGVGTNPVAFAVGDLNSDGFADMAIVNQSLGAVTVLLNDGTGFFTPAAASPLATAATPTGVAIADFTNDGIGDIAVTNNGAGTLGVYVGLGSGDYLSRIELSTPAGPLLVTTAQLTTSGLPDAIITSHTATSDFVTVLLDPTNFSAGGAAGSIQTPYPGSEYVDLGVKVKATPSVHDNNEVTLQLEFEIRALSGSSVNGIPIITNRTVSQTVRLREGEPSVIAGLLDHEETKSLNGIPGFANLPGAGYAFGDRNKTATESELLIIVTPRRLSDRPLAAKVRFAGRGAGGTATIPIPADEP